jgi:hypothetical protein
MSVKAKQSSATDGADSTDTNRIDFVDVRYKPSWSDINL